MMGHQRIHHIYYILLLLCICVSCENSSGTTDLSYPPVTFEDKELVGTFAGYLISGADDKITNANSGSMSDDILSADSDDIFVVGIITDLNEARLIGDASLFICYEDSFGVSDTYYRKALGGNFSYLLWNTTGVEGPGGSGDYYKAVLDRISLAGYAWTSNVIIDGLYFFPPLVAGHEEYWQFQLFNHTTSGIQYPYIDKISGDWKIENSFMGNNTLSFTIAPSGADRATISGTDGKGNSITGQVIEIVFTDPSPSQIERYYSVNMELVRPAFPLQPIELQGLVTYIETMHTGGFEVDRTLAIGASDGSETHIITGFAVPD